jgi:hypothetical protein
LTAEGFKVTPGTKTHLESQTIDLALPLLELLKRLHAEANGRPYIFTTLEGKQFNQNNWGKTWKRIKAELGIPHDAPRFYNLRHTGNSYLDDKEVPAATRKAMLRHSPKSKLAETVYLKPNPIRSKQAVNLFDRSKSF